MNAEGLSTGQTASGKLKAWALALIALGIAATFPLFLGQYWLHAAIVSLFYIMKIGRAHV